MKVKASSNFWWVPSQTNLFLRVSMPGLKWAANSLRVLEFSPSAATTRSWVLASSAALAISVWNRSSMPSPRARCCKSCNSFLRAMPEKPWPVETIFWPR